MLGHITYLSREAMTQKFDAHRLAARDMRTEFETKFAVGSYLAYQGDRFVERFDANSYLTITLAIDLFDLGSTPELLAEALGLGMQIRGYVSTVWGCPYEGPVPVERSVRAARSLLEMGCQQISLGDTIGVGTPRQTVQILGAMLEHIPKDLLAMHMHDTRGTALANVLVGLSMGLTTFDASVGGLGGCPYAPGAAGNLATEDLVYMLHGMGVETGVDLPKLVLAGRLAQRLVGRELPGKYLKAALSEHPA